MSDSRSLPQERVRVRRMDAVLGAEATDIDLSRPLDGENFDTLRNALHRHSLLLVRGQSFTPTSLAKFLTRFGSLRRYRPLQLRSKEHARRYLCPDAPDIMRIGNLMVSGKSRVVFTNASPDWHIDDLYKPNPHEATALFAVETPTSGGDTLFTSLRAAYEALDDATKGEIEHLRCVYSIERLDAHLRGKESGRAPLTDATIAANPPAIHPLVRIHSVTGKKGLLFERQVITQIKGLSKAASETLLIGLEEHALSSRFQYRHKWRNGDLLIWDNLSTMHRATEFNAKNDRRLLYRAMIARVR